LKKESTTEFERKVLEDDEIIELYWSRNELAINETDKKYRTYLYTIAKNILADSFYCDECLNDTYFGAWNAIPPTRPSVLRLFLAKITRNTAVDRLRHDAAERRIPSELVCSLEELDFTVASDERADESLVLRELVEALNSYLRSIPGRDEFIFVCRYYYGDSVKRIAAMLDTSEKTVYRALSEMRRDVLGLIKREGMSE